MKKHLEILVALFLLAGGVFASIQTFATNERVDLVAERLDKKILTDRLHAIQERIWAFDDRYGEGCYPCDEHQKDTYRRLQQDLRDVERELKGGGKNDGKG